MTAMAALGAHPSAQDRRTLLCHRKTPDVSRVPESMRAEVHVCNVQTKSLYCGGFNAGVMTSGKRSSLRRGGPGIAFRLESDTQSSLYFITLQ
jgi:hypothetical protein